MLDLLERLTPFVNLEKTGENMIFVCENICNFANDSIAHRHNAKHCDPTASKHILTKR